MISHAITFLDDVAMRVPSLDAWDQFVWPPGVAMPRATTEVEQYVYRHGQAVDLGPVMPATQLRVTDEVGTYLCAVQALVFEGSVLAYNPTRDEVEWVPTHGVTIDLSWVEEKSAVALANYVPCISQEVAHIAGLRTRRLMSWPNDSSEEEEEEEDGQEEEYGQEEEEEPQKWRNRGKRALNHRPAVRSSTKVRRSKRLNHGDDDDCGSGSLSWMRKNLSLLMTHGRTPMPQLVAAPLYSQPHRCRGCQGRLWLRCMHRSRRWRNSELVGHEGHPVLTSVNLYICKSTAVVI